MGITRAAKKLLSYELITAQKLPDNHKNIYYCITLKGEKIAQIHDQMHSALKTTL